MIQFNDEERALHEIYKGMTKEETISNIGNAIPESPEHMKERLEKVKRMLENRN